MNKNEIRTHTKYPIRSIRIRVPSHCLHTVLHASWTFDTFNEMYLYMNLA